MSPSHRASALDRGYETPLKPRRSHRRFGYTPPSSPDYSDYDSDYEPARRGRRRSISRHRRRPYERNTSRVRFEDTDDPDSSRRSSTTIDLPIQSKRDRSRNKASPSRGILKRGTQDLSNPSRFPTTGNFIEQTPQPLPYFQCPMGDRDVTVLLNHGQLTIPQRWMDEGNVGVLGRKDCITTVVPTAVPTNPSNITCKRCNKPAKNEAILQRHNQSLPNYCKAHMRCIGSWQEHITSEEHIACPLPTCPIFDRRFANVRGFVKHWRSSHCEQQSEDDASEDDESDEENEASLQMHPQIVTTANKFKEQHERDSQLERDNKRLSDENRRLQEEERNRLAEENRQLKRERARKRAREREDSTGCCVIM
jgi:hypothetical protein